MMSFRFKWIGLLAALWVSWGHGDAFAQKLYWTDVLNHKIQRADVDCLLGPNPGGCIETVLDTLSVVPPTYDTDGALTHPGAKSPNSVVVDVRGGRIYWSDFWTGVHRTTMDGLSTENIVPTPTQPIDPSWGPPVCMPNDGPDPCRNDPRYPWESTRLLRADIQGIALDLANQVLYFGPDHPFESPLGSKYLNPYPNNFEGGRIRRSNLDGSDSVDLLSNAVDGFPGSLALDLSHNKMYWGSPTSGYYPHSNQLMRANLDGSSPEVFLLLDGSDSNHPWVDPRDIEVNEGAGLVYFTSAYTNSIWRVQVDGTALTELYWGLDTPQNIVLDIPNNKMYFAEVWHNVGEGEPPPSGAVSRANLDGSGGYQRLVTGLSFPAGTFAPDFPFAPNGIAIDLSPFAKAAANPASGDASLQVKFSSDGSSDPEGGDLTYSWTFGEGDPSNEPNPLYTYSTPGTYTAKLVVTNIGGLSSSATVNITVTAPNQAPVATATANLTSGDAPLTVSFTGAGSDLDGSINSYSWDFGDGSDPTPSASASHIYQRSGNYHAVLTVTDNLGAKGTASVNISVANRLPVASATANPTSGPASLTVSFTGAGSDLDGSIKSYSWAFGDGGTSSSISLSHTYDAPGNYTAVLTVTDDEDGTGTSSVTVTVQHPSQPDLVVSNVSALPSPANAGDSITVTDTTNNPGAAQAAASMTFIYFSLNTTLDAGDTLIGSRSAGALSAGSSSTGSTQVTIPPNRPAGTYYVIVMADGPQGVGESSETNNTATSAAISVGDPNSRPDLIVSSLSTSVSSTDTGVQVRVTDTTKNQGVGKAAASQTHIYLSPDATLHPGDPLLGSHPVVALNAGTNNPVTTYVPIPAGTLPGTYYVIVMADAPQALGELNETNNTRSKAIVVPGPDLVVSQLSAPARVIAGTPFTVKDTTKNQGTKPTVVTSRTNYYLSINNTFAGRVNDTPIAYREVGTLAAGASSTTLSSVSNNITIPSKGTWYVIAVADGNTVVPETDENDNSKAVKITVQ